MDLEGPSVTEYRTIFYRMCRVDLCTDSSMTQTSISLSLSLYVHRSHTCMYKDFGTSPSLSLSVCASVSTHWEHYTLVYVWSQSGSWTQQKVKSILTFLTMKRKNLKGSRETIPTVSFSYQFLILYFLINAEPMPCGPLSAGVFCSCLQPSALGPQRELPLAFGSWLSPAWLYSRALRPRPGRHRPKSTCEHWLELVLSAEVRENRDCWKVDDGDVGRNVICSATMIQCQWKPLIQLHCHYPF